MEIPNTLFSETKRKELCLGKDYKTKMKQIVKKWKERLDADELKIEEQNKGHFRDLLTDALGYPKEKIREEVHKLDFSYIPPSGKGGVLFELKSRKKKLFEFQGYDKKEQDTPISQAITYIEKNSDIDYAVVTNFEQFVLITREDLRAQCYKFTFPPKGMKLLDAEIIEFISIFSKDSIESRFIDKMKYETIIEEVKITDDFYKLYHQTRLLLIRAFQDKTNVKDVDAIKFAQTYLNRLIFLFFAEDNGLIKEKIFSEGILSILNSGVLKEKTTKISDFIQTIFAWMDSGSNEIDNKLGFNGELFKEPIDRNAFFYDFKGKKFFEEITKKVKIHDRVKLNREYQKSIDRYDGKVSQIIINLLIMDSYNFKDQGSDYPEDQDSDDSEDHITINILGHIFEQSIGDLEELQKKEKAKRKKEGVYYTPEYVTQYICKNTIIPYLSKTGATEPHQLVLEYKDNIQELEKKFNEIKILDPACGSGAFLINSVDVLLSIHDEIQNFKQEKGSYLLSKKGKKESGVAKLLTFDKEAEKENARGIVQNNIYGVDVNPESVEITKLSLFLKIATKNKRLIGLAERIKVGNSIISDSSVAERPFHWESQFAEILDPKYGEKFDIVIGNPPYVRQERLGDFKEYLSKNYKGYAGTADLYVYFLEKGLNNLKNEGFFGVIVSNKWSKASYGENIRTLLKNYKILQFIDFGDLPIFKDATTYPCILIIKKTNPNQNSIYVSKPRSLEKRNFQKMLRQNNFHVLQNTLTNDSWAFQNNSHKKINDKINKIGIPLEQYCSEKINRGLLTGLDKVFVIDEQKKNELENKAKESRKFIKPYLVGKQIKRYYYNWENTFILLIKKGEKIERFPSILNYLKPFKKELEERWDKGDWFSLRTCSFYEDFMKPKIIIAHFAKRPQFTYDDKNFYVNAKGYILPTDDKYLLGILNSSTIAFFSRSICPFVRGEFYEYNKQFVNQFPIPQTSEENKRKIIKNVEKILENNEQIIAKKNAVKNVICADFSIEQIPSKLKNPDSLAPLDFLKIIKKLSKPGTTEKKLEELCSYFSNYKSELSKIENEIIELDSEIDEIVFSIFNLSKNEITIIMKELSKDRSDSS